MKRGKKLLTAAVSLLLSACMVFSVFAVPARAVETADILKGGLGVLSSVAGAVGPALFGKILNATGHSELADYFGLNTNKNLLEIRENVKEIQETLGTISQQVSDLEQQLASVADRLQSWTTLTEFKSSYGSLSTMYDDYLDAVETLARLQDNNTIDQEAYDTQVAQLMTEIHDGGAYRIQVLSMGDAIMGEGTSLVTPTYAYYQNRMQVNEVTRDELKAEYLAFSTAIYQDYVMSVMLCSGSMAYLSQQQGGNVLYEIQMDSLSRQAQRVSAFLFNEYDRLFPADAIDGYDGPLPDRGLVANDYIAVYKNGKVEKLTPKSSSQTLVLSDYHLLLQVGETSAVKVFKNGQQIGEKGVWSSLDETVAAVDRWGGVFATGVGTTTLTATYGGETRQVQVEVADLSPDGTVVASTTGARQDCTDTNGYSLADLLTQAGLQGEAAEPESYSWSSTDENLAVINGDQVEITGRSGGFGMVVGVRQVRYDTKYNSYYQLEKVVFPLYSQYVGRKQIYDYDDLMYAMKYLGTDMSPISLAADLTADTAYGQICAKTKLRPAMLSKQGAMTLDGGGRRMDLMGTPLFSSVRAGYTVQNFTLYSSCVMDSAAVADQVEAGGTVKDCHVNTTVVTNRQYAGGVVNRSQGRIEGVNFYGSITNTYDKKDEPLKSKDSRQAIPYEALHFSTRGEYLATKVYDTGTGGVVGRLDISASQTDGNWRPGSSPGGMVSCYSSGTVTAQTNAGGLAGLAIGAWGTERDNGFWDPQVDIDEMNAAYLPVHASVSSGTVTARATDGVAGGVIGISVCAEVVGVSATARVVGGSGEKGRASGVSGLYFPRYGEDMGRKERGIGFRMYCALVRRDVTASARDYVADAFFFNPAGMDNYWDSYVEGEQKYYHLLDHTQGTQFGTSDWYSLTMANLNQNQKMTDNGIVLVDAPGGVNRGWPIFSGTRVPGTGNEFAMEDSYVYGDALLPATAKNVVRVEYCAQGGSDYSPVSPTDAGSYTARATYANGATATSSFEITPRPVRLAGPEETVLEFTGRPVTVKSPYVENVVPGDSVEVVVSQNSYQEVGEYTLVVTELTGPDAGNYRLAGTPTVSWSIVISNQVPTTILLTMDDLPLTQRTLYYNDTGRNTLDIGRITVAVKDQNGYPYIFKEGEAVTWTYEGDGASLDNDALTLTGNTEGSGTLVASLGGARAQVAITVTALTTVYSIQPGEDAPYVRMDEAYDLSGVPLLATDSQGKPYTLTQEELEGITWTLTEELNPGITATIENGTLTVTGAELGERRECRLVLTGTLTGVDDWYVHLTLRERSTVDSIAVTPVKEGDIRLYPNTRASIAEYLTAACFDQYGDPVEAEITWASDTPEVLGIWNDSHFDPKADGAAQVTANAGSAVSGPVSVQVAGPAKLTSAKIQDPPEAMGWNESLDLNSLTVLQYDQRQELMAHQLPVIWSVENDGKTNAQILGTQLRSGTVCGAITLKASVSPAVSCTAEIAVGPEVTEITARPESLGSQGGELTLTLQGERLCEGIQLGLFNVDEEAVAQTATVMGADGACTGTLILPANEGETDLTYTVKVYDGSGYLDAPTAQCTVSAPEKEPVDPDPGPGPGPGPGGPDVTTDPPVVEQPWHGKITLSPEAPAAGDKVTVTVTPEEGYLVDGLSVVDAQGEPVAVTKNSDGSFTFLQPEGAVTIRAELLCVGGEHCPSHHFDDVTPDAWYHGAVDFAVETGMMNGVGEGLFDPAGHTDRAMVVTILWRIEGTPSMKESSAFLDVALDSWYAQSVAWAADQGIVEGFGDGTFRPGAPITREQLAVILWRYARHKGVETNTGGGLEQFVDGDKVSGYAREALAWAAELGIVSGRGGGVLDPLGQATRAEMAAMMERFAAAMKN